MKKNIRLKKSEQIFIIICLASGLILRLHHALTTEYSIHADEIMQYLERAHLIVFGYGSFYNEQALEMRSLLVPGFIAFWLWLCKILNLADPNVYIPLVKVIFVMLSMAVPIGVYRLARRHYGQTVAIVSLVFVSLWYQMIYWAHKPLASVVSTSLIFLYFTFLFKEKATVKQQGEQKISSIRISSIRLWIMGLTLTLALPIRIQYAPLCFCLLCYTLLKLSSWRERWHLVSSCFTGVLLFMGVLDWLTIGYPFQAMYNNIYYNVFKGMASSFGTDPFHQYFLWMGNTFSFFLYPTLIFTVIRLFKKDWLVFACFLSVIISLSMLGHKEPRFIFAATPFFLIMLSHWFTILFDWMTNKILRKRFINKRFSRKVISLWSLVIFLVLLNAAILKKNKFKKHDSLYALKAIRNDPNVTGVFDTTSSRSSSGGYYYLHKAIPYYINYGINGDRNTDGFRPYISHLIRRVNSKNKPIKYFFKWKNSGNLEIYKRIDKHYPQKMWNHYKVNKVKQRNKSRFALKNKRFKPPPPIRYVEPRQ